MAGHYTPTPGGVQTLTAGQLETVWVNNGGPPAVAPVAAAIALAESGGRSVKQQGQPWATTGWGPWQITPGNPSLLDVNLNAQAAVAKYKAAGNSFSPWTTYTSGKYLPFLHRLQQQGSLLPAYIFGGLLGAAAAPAIAAAVGGGAAATAEGEAAATGAASGGTAGGLTGALKGLSSLASLKSGLGAAALLSVLLDPKHVLRALMVVGGIALILIALVFMVKSQMMKAGR